MDDDGFSPGNVTFIPELAPKLVAIVEAYLAKQ
jgi:hypothetical protein